jgi:hypothetical protein
MRRGATAAFPADRHGARREVVDEVNKAAKQTNVSGERYIPKGQNRYAQRWCSVAAEHCMENILSVFSNVELITIRSLREETNNYYGMRGI